MQTTTPNDCTPAEARTIAKEAYIYGFPMVDNLRVQYSYFTDKGNPEYKAAYNTLFNIPRGGSSKPDCCYAAADFAGDIVAFMDALGIQRASLVGHSMGSFIVGRVAVDFPDRVNKLVLIGSAPTVAGNAVALELKAYVDTVVDPVDPGFVREFQASTFVRPLPDGSWPITIDRLRR